MTINNKRGAEELTTRKIIMLILALLVLVFIFLAIFKPDLAIWNYIKNLPDYNYNETDTIISDLSPDELAAMGCTQIIGKLGEFQALIRRFSYNMDIRDIYIGNGKSNLYIIVKYLDYLKEKKSVTDRILYVGDIFLRVGKSSSPFSKDVKVGMLNPVTKKINIDVDFLDENSQAYAKYKDKLPSANLMGMLDDSMLFLDGALLCKTQEQVDEYKEAKKCTENCSLYDGNCRQVNSCASREVSYGQIDCKSGYECCVKEKREKLKDGEMNLGFFEFFWPKESYKVNLNEGQLGLKNAPIEKSVQFTGGINYSKPEKEAYSTPFCYVIRTDKEKEPLKKEFLIKRGGGGGLGFNSYTGMNSVSVVFAFTNEKTFELVAWDPLDNKKVFKRISISYPAGEQSAEQSNYVPDKEFWTNLKPLGVGKGFYTLIAKGYIFKEGEVYVTKFWIEKTSDSRARICAEYGSRGLAKKWYELDCTNGNMLRATILLDDVGYSLTETLGKCSWKWTECN